MPSVRSDHTPANKQTSQATNKSRMDLLTKFNVSCEMTTDEFLRRLGRAACLEEVQSLRSSLFAVAMEKGLVDEGGMLVARKKSAGGKSVKWKYMEDVWVLVGSIRNKKAVPHVLLKRSREEMLLS